MFWRIVSQHFFWWPYLFPWFFNIIIIWMIIYNPNPNLSPKYRLTSNRPDRSLKHCKLDNIKTEILGFLSDPKLVPSKLISSIATCFLRSKPLSYPEVLLASILIFTTLILLTLTLEHIWSPNLHCRDDYYHYYYYYFICS